MLKNLISLVAPYKLYIIVFSLITSHGAVIKFTSNYKDGQFAKKELAQELLFQQQKENDQAIIERYAKALEEEKQNFKVKDRIIYKKVVEYATTPASAVDCFDDTGYQLLIDTIKKSWPADKSKSTNGMSRVSTVAGGWEEADHFAMVRPSDGDVSGLLF